MRLSGTPGEVLMRVLGVLLLVIASASGCSSSGTVEVTIIRDGQQITELSSTEIADLRSGADIPMAIVIVRNARLK